MSTASLPSAAGEPRENAHRTELEELAFDRSSLAEGRQQVRRFAARAGLDRRRAGDLVLAVNELLTNSVRHGGGFGAMRLWLDGPNVYCEVRDRGRMADPLAGCTEPGPDETGGRGLWIVHQLCDLVDIRSSESGTAVRVSVRRA